MIATFCGHSEIANRNDVEAWLVEACRDVAMAGAHTFYLGGYGGFDALAAQTVASLKKEIAGITSILVIPY